MPCVHDPILGNPKKIRKIIKKFGAHHYIIRNLSFKKEPEMTLRESAEEFGNETKINADEDNVNIAYCLHVLFGIG